MQSGVPRKLIVVGAGGHARETIWLARACQDEWDLIGCLDDNPAAQGTDVVGVPVLGAIDQWTRYTNTWFVVAIGSPRTRRTIVQRMETTGRPQFATLVHPSVLRSSYVELGEGTMVAAGCILTTQVRISRHVLLNVACTVSHDSVLDDFATVAPGVAIPGNVHLEVGSELGVGCSLRHGLRIGRGAMVAMGSVVTKDVAPFDLVMGSPARTVRQLDEF